MARIPSVLLLGVLALARLVLPLPSWLLSEVCRVNAFTVLVAGCFPDLRRGQVLVGPADREAHDSLCSVLACDLSCLSWENAFAKALLRGWADHGPGRDRNSPSQA